MRACTSLLLVVALGAACSEKNRKVDQGAATAADGDEAKDDPAKETLVKIHNVDAAEASKLYETSIRTLDGESSSLGAHRDKALLVVNVASKCGLTPQYAQLEELQDTYGDQGFSVIGMPCNQFGGQEPGTADEIKTFCSTTYGVSFPMMEKIEVNGDARHGIYQVLTRFTDGDGEAGDVKWNFEKFLIAPKGEKIARFRPGVEPKDPVLVATLEEFLGQ